MPEEKAGQASKVCLGVISGAHGIRGEVKIKTFGEDPLAIGAYGPLSDETGSRSVEIAAVRPSKGGVVARITGVADRTQAETLKGLKLFIERSALPAPEEDEYYHADLVGLSVELSDGKAMGKVIAVQDFGAGPMLEISPVGAAGAKKGRKESILVPFTMETVPEVDLAGGRLVLNPPAELSEGPEPTRRSHERRNRR